MLMQIPIDKISLAKVIINMIGRHHSLPDLI